MRFWIRRASSILAIAGGLLFLVLPVAFLNGTASIVYPGWRCPPNALCQGLIIPDSPMPRETVLFWASLGVISILLGLVAMKLSLRPRIDYPLELAFSLGSAVFFFWIATWQILKTSITTPAGFLVFPELSVAAMVGATGLFGYELLGIRREILETLKS